MTIEPEVPKIRWYKLMCSEVELGDIKVLVDTYLNMADKARTDSVIDTAKGLSQYIREALKS